MRIKKIIITILLFIMLFTIINFTNFNKVEASTSCTADEAITKVQSLEGSTVRFW